MQCDPDTSNYVLQSDAGAGIVNINVILFVIHSAILMLQGLSKASLQAPQAARYHSAE